MPRFGAQPACAVSPAAPYFDGYSAGRTYIKHPTANAKAAVEEALSRHPEGVMLSGSHAVVAIRNENGTIYYSDPGWVAARGHNVTLGNTWVQVGHSMGYANLSYMLAID